MHAYIVVSLIAGVRPEEVRAIGCEEDVDLDSSPPSVAVLRADRAGGDTKTPRSRRAEAGADGCPGRSGSGRWTRRLSGRPLHTFVSLLSDDGMAIEKIARLVGDASSHVTETVCRQELTLAMAF